MSKRKLYHCPETGRGDNQGKPHMKVHKRCMALWAKSQDERGKSRILCVQPGCKTDMSHLLPLKPEKVLARHPVVAMLATAVSIGGAHYVMGEWGGVIAGISAIFASCVPFSCRSDSGNVIASAMLSGTFTSIAISTVYAFYEDPLPYNDWRRVAVAASFASLHGLSLLSAVYSVLSEKMSHVDRVAALFVPFIGLGMSLNKINECA